MDRARRPNSDDVPQEGRADLSEMEEAPHSVVCDVDGLEVARLVIEDLEEHGIPANAIELIGAETKDSPAPDTVEAVAESGAFWALSRSTIVGGLVGLVVGALLGLPVASLIPGLTLPWGMVMRGLFGAAVGGTAGGISVAKYSSPAWDETHEVEETKELQLGVHHVDLDVINAAATVMERHVSGEVRRQGTAIADVTTCGEFRATRFGMHQVLLLGSPERGQPRNPDARAARPCFSAFFLASIRDACHRPRSSTSCLTLPTGSRDLCCLFRGEPA